MKNSIIVLIMLIFTSCVSIKSTIKNINESAILPDINQTFQSFILNKKADNEKYGHHPDYPINVGFTTPEEGTKNITLFLNALAGMNGEKITYSKIAACCPYPTKKDVMGVALIDKYEIVYGNIKKPIVLHFNRYEKGELMIPSKFTARK
jgi:hypothetical protein